MKVNKSKFYIITDNTYGVYFGRIESAKLGANGLFTVQAKDARHMARFITQPGEISSVAAVGLCDSTAGKASDSYIGRKVANVTICNVANIWECTDVAANSINTFNKNE